MVGVTAYGGAIPKFAEEKPQKDIAGGRKDRNQSILRTDASAASLLEHGTLQRLRPSCSWEPLVQGPIPAFGLLRSDQRRHEAYLPRLESDKERIYGQQGLEG